MKGRTIFVLLVVVASVSAVLRSMELPKRQLTTCIAVTCASVGEACNINPSSTPIACTKSFCKRSTPIEMTGICAKDLDEGAPCMNYVTDSFFDDQQCKNGYCSDSNICVVPRDIGGACARDDDCKTEFCNSVTAQCESPYKLPLGASCLDERNGICLEPNYCGSSGVCTAPFAIGATCSRSSECGYGNQCAQNTADGPHICMEPFSIPDGGYCDEDSASPSQVCQSGVCGRDGKCVSPTTAPDDATACPLGDASCPVDALCMCSTKTGVMHCAGFSKSLIGAMKSAIKCYNQEDPMGCVLAKSDYYMHLLRTYYDLDPCNGAGQIAAWLCLVVAALAVLF